MKIKWKPLIISVAIPLLVGGISALLTRNSMQTFDEISKPPLSPPGWLFPVVWTILYTLMGIASYIIWTAVTTYEKRREALGLYAIQLMFNFLWPIIFFNLKEYFFAFIWIVTLWLFIFATKQRFEKIDKTASYLLIPYLVWVAFAAYLNLGVWILN